MSMSGQSANNNCNVEGINLDTGDAHGSSLEWNIAHSDTSLEQKQPSSVQYKRGKYHGLSTVQKLDVIMEYERGVPAYLIMEKYNISKSSLYSIRRSGNKIKNTLSNYSSLSVNALGTIVGKKRNKKPGYPQVDKAVYAWLVQQQTRGVPLRPIEIRNAAENLAKKLKIDSFKASSGWLCNFRRRNNIENIKICDEAVNADSSAVERVKEDHNKLIVFEGLQPCHLNNEDEIDSACNVCIFV